MTDSLSQSDVERVDSHVDPTAVNADDIEDSLNDDFEGGARDAFAQALEEQRGPVRDEARDLLSKRLATNPASGETQLRNSSGQWSAKASEVQGTRVTDSGRVEATTSGGDTIDLGTVDLDAGAAEGTRDRRYSR